MAGFNPRETAAERSLEKSSRELRTLKNIIERYKDDPKGKKKMLKKMQKYWKSPIAEIKGCLLYTSPSPRDRTRSRMPSSA